jgi:hypothetical protein
MLRILNNYGLWSRNTNQNHRTKENERKFSLNEQTKVFDKTTQKENYGTISDMLCV